MTSAQPDAPTRALTEVETSPGPRLFDAPDWLYLLRDFDALYRHGSAGGSRLIRAHRKRVRDALSQLIDANPEIVARSPQVLPVTAHLPRALDLGERGAVDAMARSLGRVAPALVWEYGYDKVPKSLAQKYAYCEVVGPRGPVRAERLVLGFVLLAPRTTYPQHSHAEIEESYISIAGAWSENDTAVHAPGSLILNRPGHEHRITTADLDPCLLAYAWIGPGERLTAPGMKFSTSRRSRIRQGI